MVPLEILLHGHDARATFLRGMGFQPMLPGGDMRMSVLHVQQSDQKLRRGARSRLPIAGAVTGHFTSGWYMCLVSTLDQNSSTLKRYQRMWAIGASSLM